MKYRNTSFSGKQKYYLVKDKEEKSFEKDLEEFKEITPYLAANIHGFSDFYDENSRNQAYLIYQSYLSSNEPEICLGGIVIVGPLFEHDPLKLKICINEENILNDSELFRIVEDFVKLFSRCNYNRERINIELENNFDLSKMNCYKYKKGSNEWEKNCYICNNDYYGIIQPVLEEILNTNERISDEELKVINSGPYFDPRKFTYPIDQKTIEEYTNHKVPFAEIFEKSDNYLLSFQQEDGTFTEINYRYNGVIDFANRYNGGIDFADETSWDDKNYSGEYNIFNNSLQICNNKHFPARRIEISDNKKETEIISGGLTITKNKFYNLEKITHQTEITNDASIKTDILMKDNEVAKCNVDFCLYKRGRDKINGTYMLRWHPEEEKLSFTYHNRKGENASDLTEQLELENPEFFAELNCLPRSLETADKLISQVIAMTNNTAAKFTQTAISTEVATIESNTIKFLESTSGHIHPSHLSILVEDLLKGLNEKNKKVQKIKK